ncbi:MAG: hypothetical protein QXH47_07880 [Candidatus Bathyarchaeia archaeon]
MGVGLQGNIKLNFQCSSRGDMCIGDCELREVEAFEKSKVFLSIQPHPDDTDIAAGGAIAKLANTRCQIINLTEPTPSPELYKDRYLHFTRTSNKTWTLKGDAWLLMLLG